MGELVRFGGNAGTTISPLTIVATALAVVLILFLPKKYVIAPYLMAVILIPTGEQVVLAGMHWMIFRIILFFGLLRILISRQSSEPETMRFQMNRIDWTVILFCISSIVTFTLLWGEGQAFVNRIGFAYNTIGGYFVVRVLVRDEGDVDRTTRVFATICAIIAACMTFEYLRGQNLFAIFGGVDTFSALRGGHIRAQGPFAHPILAGTFGATLVPLFVGLWWQERKYRTAAIIGLVSATAMVITCASSTPLLAYVAGIGGLSFWLFRKNMRLVRWGTVLGLLGLQSVMKAPIWALIARVDVVGGSSGDQRYQLVDKFIRHFGQWWAIGTKYSGTWGWDMFDTSNQYVDTGVTGGLLTLVLFIAIIVYGFKTLGIARAQLEAQGDVAGERRCWVMGAAIFSTCVAFLGISYFDQTAFAWYCLLAMISSLSASAFTLNSREVRAREENSACGEALISSDVLATLHNAHQLGITTQHQFPRDEL